MPNYSGIWTEQAVMQANGAGNWPNAPGAPTIGTATDTGAGGAVSVAFTAPTFAGLPATITSYTVTSSPGGLTGTGASSPITVSGLTNGTAYTFTVTATNASGTGPSSAASNSVTPSLALYVEDVFQTWVYTGNSSTQTITNGIDLAGEGGLVWFKQRNAANNHALFDTSRGTNKLLYSNTTSAQVDSVVSYSDNTLTAFNANGFTLGNDPNLQVVNTSPNTYASWTFRKQPKFFDVVTYTGNSTSGRTVAHNLGSEPGFIAVKRTDVPGDWMCYHRSITYTGLIRLNLTNATLASSAFWVQNPTATEFTVGSNPDLNETGGTYVAYLFAHNAGGFGLTGTDNVISCGSVTNTSQQVDLGYEPQWIMYKKITGTGSWNIFDNMRGMTADGSGAYLQANSTAVEATASGQPAPNATGFYWTAGAGATCIYIAIRRGPMKVPTSGTSVFAPTLATFNGTTVTNTGFVVDMVINKTGVATGDNNFVLDRLRGSNNGAGQITLPSTSSASAEVASSGRAALTGSVTIQNGFLEQDTTANNIVWAFGRAPSFFDEVCYTGNVTTRNIPHNLGVAPELVIGKRRSGAESWYVWCTYAPNSTNTQFATLLDSSVRYLNWGSGIWGDYGGSVNMNATTYSIGSGSELNQNASTNVTYLFATCPNVSKVGGYTGTGTTQQINCGFTAGARFVLIKRVDGTGSGSVGDWYVWDSARGIVAGNDPYLLLNSTAAEVTSTDYIDTYSAGFEISSTAPAAINASGGTYIFLAIA